MLTEWKTFLESEGAIFAGDEIIRFSSTHGTDLQTSQMMPLTHLGLIRASGADAQGFLQNQFCNDVRQVDDAHSQLNGYCTPKGRLLALFRLLHRGDGYLLVLPREQVEPTLKRLRMFVLRSQVVLEDVSDALIGLGLVLPDGPQSLPESLRSALPEPVNAAAQSGALTIVRVPGRVPRCEIYGPLQTLQTLWRELVSCCTPAGTDRWEYTNIEAALPQVYAKTREAFVPQMVNLESLQGLSYKKGCYPGQEIVARTHYLGKLKRRMYLGHLADGPRPHPGDSLFSEGDPSGQPTGEIVDARPAPNGGFAALAVLRIELAEAHPLHVGASQGPMLQLQALPYPPPE